MCTSATFVILFVHQNSVTDAKHKIIVTTISSLLYCGNFGVTSSDSKTHCLNLHAPPAISQPGANLVTVLPAVLVPACTLLIVGAAIAVVCVMRRRQSVAIKSRDGVDMISVNREETGGLVDTYIVKLSVKVSLSCYS